MTVIRNLAGAAAALTIAGCATTPKAPDLVVGLLGASPAEATVGSPVTITSSIRNDGAAASNAPAALDIAMFADTSAATPLAALTGWRQRDDDTLAPAESVEDAASVNTPPLPYGSYSICAVVDPENSIPESNETNNRTCIPFTILQGAPRAADLVIESVTSLGQVEASTAVRVKLRNAGAAAAGPFRVMAFRRNPRQPILFIECPLTEGQLAAGSPATCDDVQVRTGLAAGETKDVTGYLSYIIPGGANLVETPVGPGNPNPLVRRDIDFMVDGCFPPQDGAPVWCAVGEVDEINNFFGKSLKTR